MPDALSTFEQLARKQNDFAESPVGGTRGEQHPFDERSIHPDLPSKVRKLYDDGHYSDATFTAFKYLESEVKKSAGVSGKTGFGLMMDVFNETGPTLALNPLSSDSEKDEQKGFRHMFAGAVAGIRNPRGHEAVVLDAPDLCLDHLSFASLLLRTLDEAGLR